MSFDIGHIRAKAGGRVVMIIRTNSSSPLKQISITFKQVVMASVNLRRDDFNFTTSYSCLKRLIVRSNPPHKEIMIENTSA